MNHSLSRQHHTQSTVGEPFIEDIHCHTGVNSEPRLNIAGPSYSPQQSATLDFQHPIDSQSPLLHHLQYSDEPYCLNVMMEKMRGMKVGKYVDKLAVDSGEVGLSNPQLMLCNYDLKPVEPERRQWRSWNFVAFWIADSFNIV